MARLATGRAGHPFAVTNANGSTINVFVQARDLWALEHLIAAGQTGCTPVDQPAPRWSAYVYNLRQMGVEVETIHEPHGPPFPGNHARYVLRSRVERLQRQEGARHDPAPHCPPACPLRAL
jgi:hypothetical protein